MDHHGPSTGPDLPWQAWRRLCPGKLAGSPDLPGSPRLPPGPPATRGATMGAGCQWLEEVTMAPAVPRAVPRAALSFNMLQRCCCER